MGDHTQTYPNRERRSEGFSAALWNEYRGLEPGRSEVARAIAARPDPWAVKKNVMGNRFPCTSSTWTKYRVSDTWTKYVFRIRVSSTLILFRKMDKLPFPGPTRYEGDWPIRKLSLSSGKEVPESNVLRPRGRSNSSFRSSWAGAASITGIQLS